jgi:hypothetical protein
MCRPGERKFLLSKKIHVQGDTVDRVKVFTWQSDRDGRWG